MLTEKLVLKNPLLFIYGAVVSNYNQDKNWKT